ncbi:unnamed protein product [Coffea canephora]|uniref:DH200=94 genomic scaffold, scaffold_653 n=1 Tax=Coffea canephora TaxID=49390 RepID=A0A068VGR7_COFCA|nr:unnamed protein product [Coffea canephora]
MSVREQLLMFLQIVGYNLRFRVVGGYLYRSTETIHRYFSIVLDAILKLYPDLIQLPNGATPREIRNSRRYYPWFADCVGAIDGTHVVASVPLEIQGKFRGRKGYPTQNVLAAISFDLKFSYVLAGWEGSAHDSRVLEDALTRPRGLQVLQDKYYLVDAGYGIRNGFIPPYSGVRYHLKEYDDNPPQNEKELFNLRHSSLRTTIERGFGVLKKRFKVVDNDPFWDFKTQVDVILACCIIHNHIMGIAPNDMFMEEVIQEEQSETPNVLTEQASYTQPYQTQSERRAENREWARKRDAIAHAMYMGKKGEKQFRWSRPMERLMLEILADEVKLGNRPNNSFKSSSFTRVVDAMKDKFGVTCSVEHVENHLRTVRSSWSTIVKIREKSGFGWDDTLKMITASPSVYHAYIQKNPGHDKYIDNKIELYDEMAVVVGKDLATGSFAKSFVDVNLETPFVPKTSVEQKDVTSARSSEVRATSSRTKQHHKRNRSNEDIEKMSQQLGEVAAALNKISANKLDINQLHEEIMKIEGYSEEFLDLSKTLFDFSREVQERLGHRIKYFEVADSASIA